MPHISFAGLVVVAAIAVVAPLLVGLFPQIRVPSVVLMIVGSLNWGLVGVANFDLVAAIFGQGSMLSRTVYALVGLAGLYGIALALRLGRRAA